MDLKNTYLLLRHGHSLANGQDLIVSSLEEGIKPQWGLSPTGQQQATEAGQSLLTKLNSTSPPMNNIIVFTSPFSRTVETAVLAAAPLSISQENTKQFLIAEELRERYFGEYELQSSTKYELVWKDDAQGTHIKPPGDGESVDDVATRMHSLINKIESTYDGYRIILVSHGDALSILASVLLKTDLGNHRQHGLPNCGILEISKNRH